MEQPYLKGEQQFLRKFESTHKEQKQEFIEFNKTKEKVRYTLEEIKKEIQELPEIKREEEFHKEMPSEQMTDILSQAIEIALKDGIEKGFQFIYSTKNPYLIDAFHDLLVSHFVDLLSGER
jgi:hypothetical protein